MPGCIANSPLPLLLLYHPVSPIQWCGLDGRHSRQKPRCDWRWQTANLRAGWRLERKVIPTGIYLGDWGQRLVLEEQWVGEDVSAEMRVDHEKQSEGFRFLTWRQQGASEDFSPDDPVFSWVEGRGVVLHTAIHCMALEWRKLWPDKREMKAPRRNGRVVMQWKEGSRAPITCHMPCANVQWCDKLYICSCLISLIPSIAKCFGHYLID